ncbi:cytochrome c3 family protein [Sphingomonas alpina]|uniref:Cytochrome c3 family protein n=1 Tax=Sphingomonas alpina TaxID=653931 RepID=A0A7H0LN17_9SPHN|nr:cytochrome c3 family protein [Sphingomonas alpina]QNQ11070.1 cytochrome c3 family protein [Sphingomonas alpina]
MSFLIRQISHTADGREIVRGVTHADDSLTIGRAANNDIALPDLAVTPYHARIDLQDDKRITITALGTLGFEVDGRTRSKCDVNSAKGAEIAIGGHRITVSHDAEDHVVLTVQRVEAVSDAAEYREEATAFSLHDLMLSKRRSAYILAIGILLVFLAWPVWTFMHPAEDKRSIYAFTADHNWSSGPLSQAHHELEGKCTACHQQAFVSVRDTSCTACHKDAHEHAPPSRLAGARAMPGLGGRLLQGVATAFGKPEAGACVDCHTEHEGAGPMPPTAQAFCTDCHGSLKQRLADTKIENAGDFGTTHPQFRPLVAAKAGAQPALSRVSLDARPLDESGLKFPHKLHLDTRGGAAQMARTLRDRKGYGDALVCADCHRPTADGVRFLPVDMEQDCQACHSLAFDRIGGTVRTLRHGDAAQMMADLRALYRSTAPPRPLQLGGMARRRPGHYAEGQVYNIYFGAAARRPAAGDAAIRAVFSPGGACFDCHTVTPPGVGGAADWTVMPVHQASRYMMKGWFDHKPHRTETCVSCHAAPSSMRSADLLLPGIATCRTCHGGEGSKAKVPSTCASCHSYHAGPDAPWVSHLSPKRVAAMRPGDPGGGAVP